MISFVNTGLDDRILKSMPVEEVSEDLEKAMNKQGMVQKEVQVKGKNGTFTRKQWVRASESGSTQVQLPQKDTTGTARSSFYGAGNFYEVGKSGDFKKDISFLSAKPDGVTIRIRHADKSETYAMKKGKDNWVTDTGTKLSTNDIVSSVYSDGAKATLNYMVHEQKSNPSDGTKYSRQDKDDAFKTGGPVDISKFSFKNYLNPDGQNRNGYKTYRDSLQSVASETEKAATTVLSTYGGSMKPYDQLRIKFSNINGHSSYRDIVDNSSEQGLKDAKSAILARQKELLESVKDYTEWDGAQRKWVKTSEAKDTGKTSKSDKKDIKNSSGKPVGTVETVRDKSGRTMVVATKPDGTKKEFVNTANAKDKAERYLLNEASKTSQLNTTNQNPKLTSKDVNNSVKSDNTTGQKLSPSDAKKKTQEITKGVSDKKSFMEKAKAQGITWKENDHEGINWMRCCMAMNKYFENGGTFNNN